MVLNGRFCKYNLMKPVGAYPNEHLNLEDIEEA